MSIEPFIGTKISLISKVGIRYEGSLHSLNTDDSTIVLNDVRCMGTEGRSNGQEVPPSSKVHDFVVFRGEDVRDIVVDEPNPPKEEEAFEDPAIFKTYKRDEFKTASAAAPVPESTHKKPTPLKEVGIATTHHGRQNYGPKQTKELDHHPVSKPSEPENDYEKGAEKSLQSFTFDTEEPLDPSSYPINRAPNMRQEKQDYYARDSADSRAGEPYSSAEPKVFYDKKSFYDNLSHEKQLSKSDLKQEHMKQREIDIATFGKFSIRNWHSRNNSYRGRKYSNNNQFNVKAGWDRNNPANKNMSQT